MRRFYNNGTGFLETITKGVSNLTPGGAAANVVKKVIKSKEDKKSRNPDPKTPKMMDTDKDLKKEEKKSKFERPIGKLPLKVKKQRSNNKMNDMMLRYPEGKELDSETTKKIKKLKLFRKD